MSCSSSYRSYRGALTALVAGAALMPGISGCAGNQGGAAPVPRHLYVGLDASGSFRPVLRDGAVLTAQLGEGLQEGVDQITLYRVDRRTEEFYDNPAVDAAHLLPLIVTAVRTVSPVSRTYPAVFWSTVAGRAARSHQPVSVVLISDGDNDNMNAASAREISRAAQQMGRLPQVRVVIVAGVAQRNRQTLRALMEPALGERLHLFGPNELSPETIAPLVLGR